MATGKRSDGRRDDAPRPLKITRSFTDYAEGSALIELGGTKVLCNASVEDGVPPFLRGSGKGWLTAEYSMLPRSTSVRGKRESSAGRVGGRTHEIQRLIGRALRSVTDLKKLGERTIWLDCDVIQADGGTRTASITGAYIALCDALQWMKDRGDFGDEDLPLKGQIAAVSVGISGGRILLDMNYEEDSAAEVDMNIVMTDKGRLVEIQGTGEEDTFSRSQLQSMLALGAKGINGLISAQKKALNIK